MKNRVHTESSATPSQINELLAYTRSFRRYPKGYRAIHMHFSVLDRLHQQPHHRRNIATAFNKLINTHEGKLFWSSNFDFFFICKDCPHTKLEQAKFDAIRAVSDSPILKSMIDQGEDHKLCDWYDLGIQYTEFYQLVETLVNSTDTTEPQSAEKAPTLKNLMADLDQDNRKSNNPKQAPDEVKQTKDDPLKGKTLPEYAPSFNKEIVPGMGPVQLDKLERNLQSMDVFSLIAEQDICVIVDKASPSVVYSKKYISLDEVSKSILPSYDISKDKWLFQRLTKTFDKKLMKALIDYESFPENVLAINMNVSTILTSEFDRFIARQKKLSDHPLILEITLFDIISDLTEYFKAQEKIKALGCKICICKMDIQSLYILDRELMNVDFIKIRWNKHYENALKAENKQKIIDAIIAQGKMRVVLSDCDSLEALNFGKSVGIVMYQGFEVDKLQENS